MTCKNCPRNDVSSGMLSLYTTITTQSVTITQLMQRQFRIVSSILFQLCSARISTERCFTFHTTLSILLQHTSVFCLCSAKVPRNSFVSADYENMSLSTALVVHTMLTTCL